MRAELQIGGVAVPVELNGSAAARALAARLPQALSMSVSSVGCCGQLGFSLPYDAADVHPGWSDGDLNYKPEGDWLALFFDDERNSARYGGQVTLGHAVGPLDALCDLEGTHGVRIESCKQEPER
ncbi:cyclophilin-like fold protein [Thermophilibacter provencensis]|uniref:Cyclophilin-like fold protein n=1 Tax=Thermophilibacter provencensis TaxID=1852386 RepID=A0ABT7V423_9ACTN|nr:cyclophilin-like fold protein [Thermophilibacter provencensis]MDM8271336.1 cyclophilin-like fold protein [Thermophilibacter provencensis]